MRVPPAIHPVHLLLIITHPIHASPIYVIPWPSSQEASSPKVAVRPERRRSHALELASSVGLALEILTRCEGWCACAKRDSQPSVGGRPSRLITLPPSSLSCISQPGDRTKELVLEAFGAWLKLSAGRGLPSDGASLAAHPLTVAALAGLG